MRSLLSMLFLLCLAAIASTQPAIRWSPYKEGQYSNFKKPMNTVINNSAEFSTFWQQLTGDPKAPADVDFGKHVLIVIALGERSNGAHSVGIDSIKRTTPAEIEVLYAERIGTGQATQAITSPYAIAKMERGGANFTFRQLPAVQQQQQQHGGGTGGGYPFPNLTWRLYEADDQCNIREASTIVIDSQREFDSYWRRLTGDREAPRDINFDQERLAAIHLGTHRTNGYNVLVESVETVGGAIVVRYIEQVPAQGQRLRNRATSPYAIVRMPKYMNPILFEKRIWASGG